MSEINKLPPQDLDIEKVVLGSIMLEQDALNTVVGILFPGCFYREAHAVIYGAISRLFNRHEPVDIITVCTELKASGELEKAGGVAEISAMTSRVGSTANVEVHARIILEMAVKRELIRLSSRIAEQGYDTSTDIFDAIGEASTQLYRVQDMLIGNRKASDMAQAIEQERNHYASVQLARQKGLTQGINTGFTDLNHLTQGWQNSDLIIIAARPAMGKTSLMITEILSSQEPVAVFSLEMSELQLIRRMVVMESEVDAYRYKTATLGNGEIDHVEIHRKRLSERRIFIDDTPGLTVTDMRVKCRKLKQKENIGLIVVDYLQLMSAGHTGHKSNREQEISTISRTLKLIAKELDVPVIALSQLSRQTEARADKRPMLSDLRESGAIEQDADIVTFIHRPEYYGMMQDEDGESTAGVAEFIVAKHRAGETGIVKSRWMSQFAKFIDRNPPAAKVTPIQPNNAFLKDFTEPLKQGDDLPF